MNWHRKEIRKLTFPAPTKGYQLSNLFTVANLYCYIARLALNKMSTVIGWLLVTCPWSNSNVSRPGFNCSVVARTPTLLVGFCYMNVLIYNKTLNAWSLKKIVSFVFPRVLMFPSTSSRETSGLSGKQNWLFPSGPYIKCTAVYYNIASKAVLSRPNPKQIKEDYEIVQQNASATVQLEHTKRLQFDNPTFDTTSIHVVPSFLSPDLYCNLMHLLFERWIRLSMG